MKSLGGFLRYILNINTLWGLMVLASFVVCVVKQYLPTTSMIPADSLREGASTLVIRTTGRDNTTREFDYGLLRASDDVTFPDECRTPQRERPWLISATREGKCVRLTWDYADRGAYTVAVRNAAGVEQQVGRGTLVTLQSMTDAAFDYAKTGFDLALGLVASMVLFLGLMKVGENAGIVQLAARAFHPVLRFGFPQVPKDHPANGAILMNVTTSILGLGNAATPFGLKAMKELQSLNPHPDVATDSQVMLLAYNTAGLALLPTTLLAVRKAAGCNDPFEIIGTCIIGGAVSVLVAIIASRLLARVPFFSVKAALQERAEGAAEQGSQG